MTLSSSLRATATVLGAGLCALALAPLGTTALYVAAGLIVLGVTVFALRRDLSPPLLEAAGRARAWRGRLPAPHPVAVGALLIGCAGLSIAAASLGTKSLYGVLGACVLSVAVWLFWPLLHDLLTAPPTDVPARPRRPRPVDPRIEALRQNVTDRVRRRRPVTRGAVVALLLVGMAMLALVTAALGKKGLIALVGGLVVVSLVGYVRDRSVFFGFLAVCSLTIVLSKSFSSQDHTQSGGAIAIYVTSFDVMVLLLYGLWAWEGTLVSDLRAGLRSRLVWLPLPCALLLLPSLLAAPSVEHSAAELFRMGWMYLLYVYVAVRVRTRRHVWAILGGLAVMATIELIVVLLQWKTGGVLGLSFLGVPTHLTQRVTDTSVLGRPFGTIIHPVFMGAVLGTLALVATALAIELPRSLTKIAACAFIPCCLIPLYLAHTRASLVAVLAVMLGVLVAGVARHRVAWSTVGRLSLLALAGLTVFFPELAAKYTENFGTSHFWEEITSRLQLNDIAYQMINDHWGIGVGLNNFELVMPKYESHDVIFANNPVHNLYLLYLSEAGVPGLVAVVVVGVSLLVAAVRLGRRADRLYAGIGIGVAGGMIFLMIEELLGFSLRQDIPLATYWLLAGLVVACLRLAPPPAARSRPVRTATPGPRGRTRPTVPHWANPRRVRATLNRLAVWNRSAVPNPPTATLNGSGPGRSAAPSSFGEPNEFAAPRAPVPGKGWRRPGGPRSRRWLVSATVVIASVALVMVGAQLAGAESGTDAATPAQPADPARLVFTAQVRATGAFAIFTLRPDGTGLTQVSPADGRSYNWSRWAFGGSKIIYVVRPGENGAYQSIELMNPDGTGRQLIQSFDFTIGQPSVDPSGTYLYYSATAPWFARYALFRMDLRTGLSRNLSAVTMPNGSADTDPTLTLDGQRVVMIAAQADHAPVNVVNADGTGRVEISRNRGFNSDPDASPDGRSVVTATYLGPGTPRDDQGRVKTEHFNILVIDTTTGAQRALTQGLNCAQRPVTSPCTVAEMSGYEPRYAPNATEVDFLGAMNGSTTCICGIGLDGTGQRVLFASQALAITYFDWRRIAAKPPGTGGIGSQRPTSAVLLTVASGAGATELVEASPDLVHRMVLPLPDGLHPVQARWAPGRREIAFVAEVPVPQQPAAPHPAPPAGATRREHVTLDDTGTLPLAMRMNRAPEPAAPTTTDQVFLRQQDGSVTQLTDPWIEDWQDGVRPGDIRSNTDPWFTPDGRALVVTNRSSLTGESFLLRIDLTTGAVVNLTNATSGAVPVDDAGGAVSPDGCSVAFSWTQGDARDIYLMDATTGRSVRPLTATGDSDNGSAWLPDGSAVVYLSHTDTGDVIARADVTGDRGTTGKRTVLGGQGSDPGAPVVDPAGGQVLFVGTAGKNRNVYQVDPLGRAAPSVLQPDTQDNVFFVDWR